MMLRVGSLFAGIGGIEIGLERTGKFESAWFVEWEAYPQAVLRKHWPGVPVYGDIRSIDFKTVPPIDVLTGGFPCQDISNAGKRKGIVEGSRSGLWKEYLRAICELRPRWVIVENVAAILQRGIDIVLGDLAEVGYDAEWHCIPAAAVGAPHRRDRIFIICYPNHYGQPSAEERDRLIAGSYGRAEGSIAPGESAGSSEPGTALAHSTRRRCGEAGQLRRDKSAERSSGSGETADTEGAGLEEPRQDGLAGLTRPECDSWWSVEPDVGRVAHGVPSRVDRIKCLGNAVVPQVAEIIGRAIIAAEQQ